MYSSGKSKTSQRLFLILPLIVALVAGCSVDSGTSANVMTDTSNAFTASGSQLKIDDIAGTTSATYYGRLGFVTGGLVYGAAMHFTLRKSSDSAAYITDFVVDRLVRYNADTTVSTLVAVSTDMGVPSFFSSIDNSVTLANPSLRYVNINLNFGNNTYFTDLSNAGFVFSLDFSTMAGGSNNFFLLAQKGSVATSISSSDIMNTWSIAQFSVSVLGDVFKSSTGTVKIRGIGGSGLTAFTGDDSSTGTFAGETYLPDVGSGAFLFSLDVSGGAGTPTGSGTVDGMFLVSPNKMYLMGYNLLTGKFWMGSH